MLPFRRETVSMHAPNYEWRGHGLRSAELNGAAMTERNKETTALFVSYIY